MFTQHKQCGISGRDQRSAAFTLVELLVVISIISVLIGLLLPALASAEKNARTVLCANNEREIGLSFAEYADQWQGNLPNYQEYYAWWVGFGGQRAIIPAFQGTYNPLSDGPWNNTLYHTSGPYGIMQCPEAVAERRIFPVPEYPNFTLYGETSYAINVALVRSWGGYGIMYGYNGVDHHLRISDPQANPRYVYLSDAARFNDNGIGTYPTDPAQLTPYFQIGITQAMYGAYYYLRSGFGISSAIYAPYAIHPGPDLNAMFLDFHVETLPSSQFATTALYNSNGTFNANCIWSEP